MRGRGNTKGPNRDGKQFLRMKSPVSAVACLSAMSITTDDYVL